jgi:hypothetical protein
MVSKLGRVLRTALPLLSLSGVVSCGNSETQEPSPNATTKIVYAVRQHTELDGAGQVTNIDVAGGMGQVMDYGRYVPGGRLEILDLTTGDVENIIADYPQADVSSIDVSFDGTKVLFTMKRDAEDTYHVYWASLAKGEDGKFELHQLTFGAFDDQNAIYAPGGRIVFTTNQSYTQMGTRADEYNHSRVVTQLATMTETGGDADRKLCSQNLSHTVTTFPLSDGRIGYSRWEHLENVNDVKLFAMNPDCTQMVALSGQHGKPGNSVVQVTESTTKNVFYGIVTNRENTIQAGALVKLDARSDVLEHAFDEEKSEADAYEVLTPSVPRGDEASPVGRYRSPSTLPDGRVLVSWAEGTVNELNEFSLTPPDYGIYIYNVETRSNELVKNYETSWELYAKPVVVRDEPEPIPSRQDETDSATPMRLGSIDVTQTSLYAKHGNTVSGAQFDEGTPLDDALKQAVKVRIIEGFSSEAAPGATMFGLTMAEGAAILGEAEVNSDGSWLAEIPPYIPVHLQPIDEFELAIRNQTTWIQGMPGEARVCGGCHEDRNAPALPADQQLTVASGKGPENFNVAIADRVEYPWAYANAAGSPNEIQGLFNAKCVSCHNETTNGDGPQETYTVTMNNEATGESTAYTIPRMDLSDRQITVYYDREVKPWPASYVSIFYPAAMEMEMDDATITGTVPPQWGIPSDARNSKLIEKLNITSSRDETVYAWPLGEAFSDATIQGQVRTDHATEVGLTREEVTMLIRAIDMGGQFYSRQNTAFEPYNNDPVAGGTQY